MPFFLPSDALPGRQLIIWAASESALHKQADFPAIREWQPLLVRPVGRFINTCSACGRRSQPSTTLKNSQPLDEEMSCTQLEPAAGCLDQSAKYDCTGNTFKDVRWIGVNHTWNEKFMDLQPVNPSIAARRKQYQQEATGANHPTSAHSKMLIMSAHAHKTNPRLCGGTFAGK